jgi:hypothetical protein
MTTHPCLTFGTAEPEGYADAWNARKRVFEEITPGDIDFGTHTAHRFRGSVDPVTKKEHIPTVEYVNKSAGERGFTHLKCKNMQSDGLNNMRFVSGYEVVDGKTIPIFTDDASSALLLDYHIMSRRGFIYVVRIFYGPFGLQATVEVLTIREIPNEFTQEWVDTNINGINSIAFKFTAQHMVPAGMHAPFGVDPKTPDLSVLMNSAHIRVSL